MKALQKMNVECVIIVFVSPCGGGILILTDNQIKKIFSIECDNTELILMLNSDCNADCKTCILKQNIYNKECSKCILFKSNAHNNCYSGVISDDSYNQKVKHLL